MTLSRVVGNTLAGRIWQNATLLGVLFLFLLFGQREAYALDTVSLQLKWLHQFQFAGYYQALEQGFYRDAGFDVKIREGGPNIDPATEVALGRADYGVCTASLLLRKSTDPKLVSLAVVFQHSAATILTTRASGIANIAQIAGRPFMDTPGSDELAAMFKSAGVDYAALPRVKHNGDPRDLVSGKADAMVAYSTNEPFIMEEIGEPYRTFSPRAVGIDFYGDNLCTSERLISSNPKRVAAFRAASLQGWRYALAHKEETVDLILKRYSTQKKRSALLFEADQTAILVQPDLVELGHQDPERWRRIEETYRDLGMTKQATVPAGLIYSPNRGTFPTWLKYSLAGLIGFGVAASAVIWRRSVLKRRPGLDTPAIEPVGHRFRISLNISILAVFLTLVLALAGILTWVNYTRTQQGAAALAIDLFNDIRLRVNERRLSLVEPLATTVTMYASDPRLARGETASLEEPWLNFVDAYPQAYEIYVGFETGGVFQVFNFPTPAEATAAKAPPGSRYAVHTIDFDKGARKELWRYLDAQRSEIKRDTTLGTYDPRVRGWYRQARQSAPELIRTPPYPFSTSANIGLTFAKAFDGKRGGGVVAANLTLTRMSTFLLQFKTGHPRRRILIFDDERRLTAFGTPSQVVKEVNAETGRTYVQATTADLHLPVVNAMVDAFLSGKSFSAKPMKIDGTVYLTSVADLPRKYGTVEYLAFAVPRDEFAGTILDAARGSALIASLITILAVPLVMWVSRRISRPLVLLAEEADRIRRFELQGTLDIHSRITEVNALAQAVSNMKNALREVTKFVPKALVQGLVGSHESVEIGGERRTMTFLFTDVQDFTPISEHMDAEALMVQTSEYFDNLVRIILAGQGTVDKYIGDAIFAFWNAPRPQDDHEHLACAAALACRDASNAADALKRRDGKQIWYTRFGIHSGEAVVGNLGSSDRLEYTAVGAAVNLASRLEGLNKFYGTQVLVSGVVRDRTKDRFLFRSMDRVLPVGIGQPVDIFELVGETERADLSSTPCADRARLVDEWEVFYAAYRQQDWSVAQGLLQRFSAAHPDNSITRLYLDRLARFATDPPALDWDGVTRFAGK